MKETKWFSTVVFIVLLGVNGLSFVIMQWQRVAQSRLIAAMGVLLLLSTTYLIVVNRSRLKSRKNRSQR